VTSAPSASAVPEQAGGRALTAKQQQLYDAIRDGATVSYSGWQQVHVCFGSRDARNYTARLNTLHALRDRGLVRLGADGVQLGGVR
jgi:hypothetical protein